MAASLANDILPAAALGRRRPGRPTLTDEQLLDKALDLFLEQGFERTSIDAITASAGMAKRTVYARYGDKETLFKAALKRAIEEWILPLEQLRAMEGDDFEESLRKIGHVLVDNIMKPEGIRLMRITNAESGRMPEIGAYTYQQGTGRTIDYLADLFRRRIGPDNVPAQAWNAAAIAFLYLVVCGPPTMTAWGMTVDEQEIKDRTDYGIQLFLYGLLPRPPARQAEKGGQRPGQAAQDMPLPESIGPLDEQDLSAPDLNALQTENRRLKKMLVASMLETASLREELESR